MHFDVLNSKMQEFGLNKTIRWIICQFTSKRSHFTVCLYWLSPVWQCRPWGSNRGNSLMYRFVEPKLLHFWIQHIKMHTFPFPFFRHGNDKLEHQAEHCENLAHSTDQA